MADGADSRDAPTNHDIAMQLGIAAAMVLLTFSLKLRLEQEYR
jgi:hypothetical protein